MTTNNRPLVTLIIALALLTTSIIPTGYVAHAAAPKATSYCNRQWFTDVGDWGGDYYTEVPGNATARATLWHGGTIVSRVEETWTVTGFMSWTHQIRRQKVGGVTGDGDWQVIAELWGPNWRAPAHGCIIT